MRFNGPWWWFENQAACGVSTGRSVGKKKRRKKIRNIFNIWNASYEVLYRSRTQQCSPNVLKTARWGSEWGEILFKKGAFTFCVPAFSQDHLTIFRAFVE